MKFIKNQGNKKALLLLLLITLSNIIQINNEVLSSKNDLSWFFGLFGGPPKVKKPIKIAAKISIRKTSSDSPPYDNPLGNLAAGIAKNLVGGNKKFMDCFPTTWINTLPKYGILRNFLSALRKLLTFLATGLSYFLKMISPVLATVCPNKNYILNLIGTAMISAKFRVSESTSLKTQLKTYRESLQSLSLTKENWGFFDIVNYAKKGLGQAKNYVVKKVKPNPLTG